jgi:uncharacterized 2Fe-2S/4Fe-4S cluster protein (DUF4445 family)
MTKKHNIILQPSGGADKWRRHTSVRSAARELGVEIESICAENATCGKCMVLVEEGRFEKYNIDSKRENLSPVSNEEAAYFARRPKLIERQRLGSGTSAPFVSGENSRGCADQRP